VKRLATAGLVAAALATVPSARAATPVSVRTSFAPLVHAFADPVTATVTVVVDSSRVEPGSVRVTPSFAPYGAESRRVVHRDAGDGVVVLVYGYRLGCAAAGCVPRAAERQLALAPARVTWRTRSGVAGVARAAWPPLTVASRLTSRDLASPRLVARIEPPAPRYAVPPGALGIGLVIFGSALALAGLGLAAACLRGRLKTVVQAPLERALELVERAAAGETVERRRALYRLALELEHVRSHRQALAARKLAWAPTAPDSMAMRNLAAGVRGREAA